MRSWQKPKCHAVPPGLLRQPALQSPSKIQRWNLRGGFRQLDSDLQATSRGWEVFLLSQGRSPCSGPHSCLPFLSFGNAIVAKARLDSTSWFLLKNGSPVWPCYGDLVPDSRSSSPYYPASPPGQPYFQAGCEVRTILCQPALRQPANTRKAACRKIFHYCRSMLFF